MSWLEVSEGYEDIVGGEIRKRNKSRKADLGSSSSSSSVTAKAEGKNLTQIQAA